MSLRQTELRLSEVSFWDLGCRSNIFQHSGDGLSSIRRRFRALSQGLPALAIRIPLFRTVRVPVIASSADLPSSLNNEHRRIVVYDQQIVGKCFCQSFYRPYCRCVRALASPSAHRPIRHTSVGAGNACRRSGLALPPSRKCRRFPGGHEESLAWGCAGRG